MTRKGWLVGTHRDHRRNARFGHGIEEGCNCSDVEAVWKHSSLSLQPKLGVLARQIASAHVDTNLERKSHARDPRRRRRWGSRAAQKTTRLHQVREASAMNGGSRGVVPKRRSAHPRKNNGESLPNSVTLSDELVHAPPSGNEQGVGHTIDQHGSVSSGRAGHRGRQAHLLVRDGEDVPHHRARRRARLPVLPASGELRKKERKMNKGHGL